MEEMKRKLIWIGVILTVPLLAAGGVFLLWPQDRITLASWEKIHSGMAEKEVEALLGEPGIYCKWEDMFPLVPTGKVEFHRLIANEDCKIWEGQSGIIGIQFDPQGNVRGKFRIMTRDGNIWDRLRDWLSW